jgi:choline dehydrogenase-like flavoprotein
MPTPAARNTVAVIGSGLSAIGAIKALRALGIRPTVIDRGERLDDERAGMAEAMARKPPAEWTAQERRDLSINPNLKSSSAIPRKLVFGSDYFYGRPGLDAPVESNGNLPPFSYALGGLSAGWGAAVLPPRACDLADWPVSAQELEKYCAKLLAELPYSARDDGLSLDFPLLSDEREALCSSRSERWLLNALERASILKKGETVFGQARLLVDASRGARGCRYCGQCMSGCVYGAIYEAGDEIMAMRKKGEIEYLPGHLVQRLVEEGGKVVVISFNADGEPHRMTFDRVFLAAGAVNSARLVLDSLGLFGRKTRLLSRGGFVIPMLSLRRVPLDWPNCNTQPGLFMEFKGKGLEHWVHVQISTENELFLQKLGIGAGPGGLLARIKRFIASHVVLLFVNYHSDHAGCYELWLEPAKQGERASRLRAVHRKSFPQLKVWLSSWMRLLSVFARISCFPLFPLAKLNSGAYHVGGTLPMRSRPSGELETDTLGRITAWERVHVVDSATFPSLPGTTIGLLAMSNAYRIVDKVDWGGWIRRKE